MKILKPGKGEMRKFVCKECGCVFAAHKGETICHPFDDDDDWVKCPSCMNVDYRWIFGEPYKEPTPTQTDRERLTQLLGETRTIHLKSEVADYLIAHGVTFREG